MRRVNVPHDGEDGGVDGADKVVQSEEMSVDEGFGSVLLQSEKGSARPSEAKATQRENAHLANLLQPPEEDDEGGDRVDVHGQLADGLSQGAAREDGHHAVRSCYLVEHAEEGDDGDACEQVQPVSLSQASQLRSTCSSSPSLRSSPRKLVSRGGVLKRICMMTEGAGGEKGCKGVTGLGGEASKATMEKRWLANGARSRA